MRRFVIVTLTLTFLILLTLCGNAQHKTPPPPIIKEKNPKGEYSYLSLRGSDMVTMSKLLQQHFDLGWEPVMSEAQSIAVAINSYNGTGAGSRANAKGDVIFILRRKK